MDTVKVEILTIYLDQETNTPIVVLEDPGSGNILPILIAPLEASMIAIELEGKKPVRPLTHDLLLNVLSNLNHKLISVVIDDLKDNIYYAKLILESENSNQIKIDCRPSDAIALAVRAKVPIYVDKKVFVLAQNIVNLAQLDKETMKKVLEEIDIDDVDGKIM